MEQMLRKNEVAKALRVTPRTVENYVKRGILEEPKRVGTRPLWPVTAVQALLGQTEGSV